MDIHEPDSTPGEGVLSHQTHCASCCRLTPKPCVIYIQWVQPACDASVCAAYSDGNGCVRSVDLAPPSCLRAVHCHAPACPALVAPYTTRSAGSRNLRWHVLLATVRANTRDACSDACASRHCEASAWGRRGCALPFYIACDAQPGHSQQISLCCHRPRPNPWVVAHNNRTLASTCLLVPRAASHRPNLLLLHPRTVVFVVADASANGVFTVAVWQEPPCSYVTSARTRRSHQAYYCRVQPSVNRPIPFHPDALHSIGQTLLLIYMFVEGTPDLCMSYPSNAWLSPIRRVRLVLV